MRPREGTDLSLKWREAVGAVIHNGSDKAEQGEQKAVREPRRRTRDGDDFRTGTALFT